MPISIADRNIIKMTIMPKARLPGTTARADLENSLISQCISADSLAIDTTELCMLNDTCSGQPCT